MVCYPIRSPSNMASINMLRLKSIQVYLYQHLLSLSIQRCFSPLIYIHIDNNDGIKMKSDASNIAFLFFNWWYYYFLITTFSYYLEWATNYTKCHTIHLMFNSYTFFNCEKTTQAFDYIRSKMFKILWIDDHSSRLGNRRFNCNN